MPAGTGAPRLSAFTWLYLGLILFSIAGATITHFANVQADAVGRLASVATILIGCIACFQPLWIECSKSRKATVVGLLPFFALIEYLGIASGFPFGRYAYSDRWWPVVRMAGVGSYPLIVPFAWLLVVGGSILFMAGFVKGWVAVPIGAALATTVDLGMEPVMTGRLGYWSWIERGPLPGHAPWQNAAAWFGLSLITGSWLRRLGAVGTTRQDAASTAGIVLGGQILLMACLSLL